MPAQKLSSAVYEGAVVHRRRGPRPHAFRVRMAQLYLDLDELDWLFERRWFWSIDRPNLAEWRRADYLGPPELPLATAVRACIARELGYAPLGPIRLLTHPRYAGYIFNPVSFYYCFAADGVTLECIVAQITNTPWGERHAYVLPVAAAAVRGQRLQWIFPKQFHVSPFLPMQRTYAWEFTAPSADLYVHMRVFQEEQCEFEATLALQHHPLDGRGLARLLWRYPLMTVQVIGAIYWQALRLWMKQIPCHEHPGR